MWNKTDSVTITIPEGGKPVNITIGVVTELTVRPVFKKIENPNKIPKTENVKKAPNVNLTVPEMIIPSYDDGHKEAYSETLKWFKKNEKKILEDLFAIYFEKNGSWENTRFEIFDVSGFGKKIFEDKEVFDKEYYEGELTDVLDLREFSFEFQQFLDEAEENDAFLIVRLGMMYYDNPNLDIYINCNSKKIKYEVNV